MNSATSAKLGGMDKNCKKYTSVRTALAEIFHQKLATPVEKNYSAAHSIVNRTAKQKNTQSNRYDILFSA